MAQKKYDIIVIGGGPGGYVAAIRASQLGFTVCLIEREHLGGICLNWGCIPTKAMLESAHVYDKIKNSSSYGIFTNSPKFDISKIVNRSKKIAEKLSNGVNHLLNKNKVDIVVGEGRLTGETSVLVNTNGKLIELAAPNIIIATGARPREIDGITADGKQIWNYKHALRPKNMPKKLLVVGSGAIGVEFATFYNNLECETTLLEMLPRILPNEDHEISSLAKKQFEERGMKVLTDTKISKINNKNGLLQVNLNSPKRKHVLEFDTVIMATGIVGNTESLGLKELGIELCKGHIVTNEFCQTTIPTIYAIGDVGDAPWLAHKASHEGVLVVEKISGKLVKPIQKNNIAGCTFCDPQIASIGLTEEQAKLEGFKLKVGRFPFLANGKALAIGDSSGFVKTIFNLETGELLGAHLIGSDVTELIHSFSIGQHLEGTDDDLIETIFPHPTLSEAIHESVLNSQNRTIHF